jgi:hypothetical protein
LSIHAPERCPFFALGRRVDVVLIAVPGRY